MKNFSGVNNVLNRVMSSLGLDKRLREHTFLTLWPTFVNGAIGDRSRAVFIDADRNLVVSVADASTGQELSLTKNKILTKLAPAARSLGIEIRGIRLDMKHYHAGSGIVAANVPSQAPPPKPEDAELAAIVLTEADTAQIAKLKHDLESEQEPDARRNERILYMFERELRIGRWRLLKGFARCALCGNPVERLHKRDSGEQVCIVCLYA